MSKTILQELKEKISERKDIKYGVLKLPSRIIFERMDSSTVRMVMSPKYIGLGDKPSNMQADNAAFEAWALYLHTYLGCCIQLEVSSYAPIANDRTPGHYNRFLYRVHKFSQQFSSWFSCGQDLQKKVDQYILYLYDSGQKFTNNLPNNEASTNDCIEMRVEEAFADSKEDELITLAAAAGLTLQKGHIYRQLPVGLFRDHPSRTTFEFTGGKSAIDLWSTDGENIVLFELKAENPMSGIITELFFYANYINDMFIAKTSFVPNRPSEEKKYYRGYQNIIEKHFSGVKAFFLAEMYHPLFTDEVLAEMNRGSGHITYGKIQYDIDKVCP